jgi:hydroxyacyl-ACP dehydratase HTD2-like protein with hotdog domain
MWAGGSVQFESSGSHQLAIENERIRCTETISNVKVKGPDGDEKVFVTIERLIGDFRNIATNDYKTVIVERRDLVFMRGKSPAEAREDAAKPGKILKRTLTCYSSHVLIG